MSTTVFPHSPTIGATPDEALLAEIADEALSAFFKVVGDRLNDLYPGSHTYGDVDPGESFARDEIAARWVRSHALNNTVVGPANGAGPFTDSIAVAAHALQWHPDGIPAVPAAKRTILVHLNIEAPATDTRTADEVADLVIAALGDTGALKVCCPLAEEV